MQLILDAVAGTAALVALIVAYWRVCGSIAALHRANAQVEGARVYNEQFRTAGVQLGDERAATRLAGARAIAGLADDWPEYRQACVAVLCAYLRMPNPPDSGAVAGSAPEERLKGDSARDDLRAVIEIITAHLRPGAEVSWRGLDLDFTGAVFDGGDFSGAEFSGGEVSFAGAEFTGGEVNFLRAGFSGGEVDFRRARFSGGDVDFHRAMFFAGEVSFGRSRFRGGRAGQGFAGISGAEFSGGEVSFSDAQFSGCQVGFGGSMFSGARVGFGDAKFASQVSFLLAKFSGGEVDFSRVADWSYHPQFDAIGMQPVGVKLPVGSDASE